MMKENPQVVVNQTLNNCIVDNKIGFKICSFCKELKPFSEFHKKKSYKSGINSTCKVCTRNYYKEYVAKKLAEDPEWKRKSNKGSRYENPELREKRIKIDQKNKCPLCLCELGVYGEHNSNSPVLDHCEFSGLNRAYLCHKCNLEIAHEWDSNKIMELHNYVK